MGTPLDPASIAKLLQEEAEKPSTSRGPRVDPTTDRTYNGWFKLNTHICMPDCPHRTDPANPTSAPILADPNYPSSAIQGFEPGNACWNPNCIDPRDKTSDRAACAVALVKGQMICRYCYLDGYLL